MQEVVCSTWAGAGVAVGLKDLVSWASFVGSEITKPLNSTCHKRARSLALKPDNFGFESLWTAMFSSKP